MNSSKRWNINIELLSSIWMPIIIAIEIQCNLRLHESNTFLFEHIEDSEGSASRFLLWLDAQMKIYVLKLSPEGDWCIHK